MEIINLNGELWTKKNIKCKNINTKKNEKEKYRKKRIKCENVF